jgi:hypothetical protein
MTETSYSFLSRPILIAADRPGMALWRDNRFSWIGNAESAIDFPNYRPAAS